MTFQEWMVTSGYLKTFDCHLILEASGADNHFRDGIRIAVGRWSSVLKITATVFADLARNPNGSTPVGDS